VNQPYIPNSPINLQDTAIVKQVDNNQSNNSSNKPITLSNYPLNHIEPVKNDPNYPQSETNLVNYKNGLQIFNNMSINQANQNHITNNLTNENTMGITTTKVNLIDLNNESQLPKLKSADLSICFTDDQVLMVNYFTRELQYEDLKHENLSSDNFCFTCCENELRLYAMFKKCCKEKCSLLTQKSLYVSSECVKLHWKILGVKT
jgi:hypothetical protein